MLSEEKIVERANLAEYENNRMMCNLCAEAIPKHIKRIWFKYKTKYGYSNFNICEKCISILSKHCDEEAIKKWVAELEQKALIKGLKD